MQPEPDYSLYYALLRDRHICFYDDLQRASAPPSQASPPDPPDEPTPSLRGPHNGPQAPSDAVAVEA